MSIKQETDEPANTLPGRALHCLVMSVRVPLCDKSLFKGVQPSRLHCIVLKTGRILCAHRDSYLGGKNVRNKRSIINHHWAVKALPSLSLFTLKPPPGKIRWANLKAATEDINENFCAQVIGCGELRGGVGLMNVLSAIAGRIRFDEEDIVQVVKWSTLWCLSSTALSPTRRDFTVSEDLL